MKEFFAGPRPVRLDRLDLPRSWRLLVLAPHPDDFESTGVTLRHFHERGHRLDLLVLSSSANGVEDSFCDPPTAEAKAALREDEQRAGCRFFGLPADRLAFLRLRVIGPGGTLADDAGNFELLEKPFTAIRPDLVVLPHGHDTNSDHRLTYLWWRRLAERSRRPMAALLFRDPKTVALRDDVILPFDAEQAAWKAELLRFHCSQHQRNLNSRGHGFDERILRVNRDSAARLRIAEPYAETFELDFTSVS
jgi:LmbE family N-acetylglucosaminyl deacetylase